MQKRVKWIVYVPDDPPNDQTYDQQISEIKGKDKLIKIFLINIVKFIKLISN